MREGEAFLNLQTPFVSLLRLLPSLLNQVFCKVSSVGMLGY